MRKRKLENGQLMGCGYMLEFFQKFLTFSCLTYTHVREKIIVSTDGTRFH